MPDSEKVVESTLLARAVRVLRPSHEHTAYSATLLLVAAVGLSRVIGYLREAYIAWAFGAGLHTDAYVAAFTLPDFVNYLLAGGTASITFISIFARYTSENREDEAQHAFSIVITVMSALLVLFILLAEVLTPQFTRWWFPEFTPDQVRLCVYLTRILLPGQIFFIIGGVVSAVLLAKRMFLIPAFAPIIYNLGIILGGVLLARHFGIASLAYGALAGSFVGPFLINAIGARRTGIKYQASFAVRHPAFIEWLWLSVPLMLGVSLVAADDWIMRHFASGGAGDITRLNYAKRLFAVPIAVLGQATGQATLPFFAKLFGEKRTADFQATVSNAVYRVAGASFLATAWMMAAALPIIDLVYRRGRFSFLDSRETAVFFFWFSISLAFWAAQGLYARAFYAAGNTLTPMVAGTLVTLAALPVYWLLFHAYSVVGLAIASDIGIAAHTVVLAVLLHRYKLVPIAAMPWRELLKALVTAVFAGVTGYFVSGAVQVTGSRKADLAALALVTVTWGAAVAAGLRITRSNLPGVLLRRRSANLEKV
ncbi:MAG: murein biosynthesis integral membrane protein MurJ [Terriglobales bacterium]